MRLLFHGNAILKKQFSLGKGRIGRNVPAQTRVSQSLQAFRLVWQKMGRVRDWTYGHNASPEVLKSRRRTRDCVETVSITPAGWSSRVLDGKGFSDFDMRADGAER